MSDSKENDSVEWRQQVLSRLSKIEHRTDSFDQTLSFSLRADAAKHNATVKAIFKDSIRRAQVYLAIDGVRSVRDIAAHLKMHRQHVGRELKHLDDEGVIELLDSQGGRDIWRKKELDRNLNISKFLLKEFGLKSNGKLDEKKTKPNRTRSA